eukprot:12194947-Alexandrium_andersonii.AAC.1
MPWALVGLASPDPHRARAVARELRAEYDRSQPGSHHRVTDAFLSHHGRLRVDLDRFVDGASMADLPAHFRNSVASLAFVGVVETTIESRHARLTAFETSRAG